MAFLLLCGALIYFHPAENWKTADRSSSGLAPLPSEEPEAVVQVYAARAFGWRKYFAVHTWIAVKETNAGFYTVYQVMGYQLPSRGTSVSISRDIPDRKWFGAEPELIQELRGTAAEKAIPVISRTAQDYPHADTYWIIPGPNSNTFTATLMREVPELTVELPPHAVGRITCPVALPDERRAVQASASVMGSRRVQPGTGGRSGNQPAGLNAGLTCPPRLKLR
ncbi:MAG: DUF3750 domain-containing protein [Akkermansia sp.]